MTLDLIRGFHLHQADLWCLSRLCPRRHKGLPGREANEQAADEGSHRDEHDEAVEAGGAPAKAVGSKSNVAELVLGKWASYQTSVVVEHWCAAEEAALLAELRRLAAFLRLVAPVLGCFNAAKTF